MNRWTFSRSTSNQDLRQRGKVMSRQPASSQDTGILLPGDGLCIFTIGSFFSLQNASTTTTQTKHLKLWVTFWPESKAPGQVQLTSAWSNPNKARGQTSACKPSPSLEKRSPWQQATRQTPDCSGWYPGKCRPFFLFLIASLWRECLARKSQRRNNHEQFWQRGVSEKGGLKTQ